MAKQRLFPKILKALSLVIIILLLYSCDLNLTGVEDSPTPGTVRVVLRANPSDTYTIERTDTFSVFTPWDTLGFYVNIFQGSVFKDSIYATLYPSITSYIQEDSVYNLFSQYTSDAELKEIAEKLDSGKIDLTTLTADYKEYTIFESYIPPGDYNKLRFGISVPTSLKRGRVTLVSLKGKISSIPLTLPANESPLKDFEVDFSVTEGRVTEIHIEISPFQSLSRYKDSYLFSRQMSVKAVKYL